MITQELPCRFESVTAPEVQVGALEIRSSGGALIATSRTYNTAAAGTFGQMIAARPDTEAAGIGEVLHLLHLSKSILYRANIGFCEVTGSEATLFRDPKAGYVTAAPGKDPEPVSPGMDRPTRVDRLIATIQGELSAEDLRRIEDKIEHHERDSTNISEREEAQ